VIIKWNPLEPGWIGHGQNDDYLLAPDATARWTLTRWPRPARSTAPAIHAGTGNTLGLTMIRGTAGTPRPGFTPQPISFFALQVLANAVPVPDPETGKAMAQVREDAAVGDRARVDRRGQQRIEATHPAYRKKGTP
jgi:hypothetical protein